MLLYVVGDEIEEIAEDTSGHPIVINIQVLNHRINEVARSVQQSAPVDLSDIYSRLSALEAKPEPDPPPPVDLSNIYSRLAILEAKPEPVTTPIYERLSALENKKDPDPFDPRVIESDIRKLYDSIFSLTASTQNSIRHLLDRITILEQVAVNIPHPDSISDL